MSSSIEEQIAQLRAAVAAQEDLRAAVGDAVVDLAIQSLRKALVELEDQLAPAEQQRKQVTVLFADVSGFTAMSAALDAEDVTEIMNALWQRLDAAITAHGGTIDKHIGDAVMALWGAATAREDDPEQAIRAALDMQEEVSRLSSAPLAPLPAAEAGTCIRMRVGINTGPVLLGAVGTTQEFTAMGDAVNVASRLQHAAPLGGVLITHDTYRHVRGIFDVQILDPIRVKGKRERLQVYLVERVKPRAFRLPTRGVEGVETRMIGRQAELQRLQEIFRMTVEDGACQVVAITGEAGVGKSRLLDEFVNWLELLPEEVRYFKGRASQERQALPYALLRDLFAFRFRIQDSDTVRVAREKLEGAIGGVLGAGEAGQMRAHLIGQLLGFDFSASPHVQALQDDARQLRDRALIYLAEFYRAEAAHAPAVILLEDIHWADDSSLDAVDGLARALAAHGHARVLIVGTARPALFERRPQWGKGYTLLNLQPLSSADSCHLVDEILQKVDQVPATLRELVVGGAEGNPFYIEELIKMLIEEGVVDKSAECWQVQAERLAGLRVPPTLSGILQARLDSLPREERATMRGASVVGRTFWDRAVIRIGRAASRRLDEGRVPAALAALQGKEMVFRRESSAFAGAEEYVFKHAILREVTYESILKRLRRGYHALVAEWLIEQSSEREGEFLGLIAEHLELAGQNERAALYLRRAGEHARAHDANHEAVSYFSRALALTPETDMAAHYGLVLARERAYDLLGSRQAQAEDLATLGRLAVALNDPHRQAEAALLRSNYAEVTGDYPAAAFAAQEAIALAQAAHDLGGQAAGSLEWGCALSRQGNLVLARARLELALTLARAGIRLCTDGASAQPLRRVEADALRILGNVSIDQGDYPGARAYYEQSLRLCREIGDRRGEGASLNNLGTVSDDEGDSAGAQAWYEQSLLLRREVGDRLGEGDTLNNLGTLAAQRGDYTSARAYFDQSLLLRREVGDRLGEGGALSNLGNLAADQGDYTTARAYYERSLNVRREIGDREGESIALGNLGLLAHQLGDNEAAREYCEQVMSLGAGIGARMQAYGLTGLGHALAGLGHLDDAAVAYQQALAIRRELGLHNLAMESLAGLARAALAQQNLAAAQFQVEEILRYLETGSLDGTDEPFRVYLTCYRVLAANADPRAGIVLTTAYNLLQERAARIQDGEMRRSFLENVAAHREILELAPLLPGQGTRAGV